MDDLLKITNDIFKLGSEMNRMLKKPLLSSDLVQVNRRCPNCDQLYIFWDKEECRVTPDYLYLVCDNWLVDGQSCGTEMSFKQRSQK